MPLVMSFQASVTPGVKSSHPFVMSAMTDSPNCERSLMMFPSLMSSNRFTASMAMDSAAPRNAVG